MRTLWLFPILHGPNETLYTFSDADLQAMYGLSASEYYGRIALAWTDAMSALDRLIISGRLPVRDLQVFCDGLPVGRGEPRRSLRMRTEAGSRDALLMDALVKARPHPGHRERRFTR